MRKGGALGGSIILIGLFILSSIILMGGSASGDYVNIWGYNSSHYVPVMIDATSNSLITIDYAHHELHDGDHYFTGNYTTLNTGQSVNLTFEVGALSPHVLFSVDGTGGFNVVIYENSTGISGGLVKPSINNNRNSPNSATVVVRRNPTITSFGGQIDVLAAGVNKVVSTVVRESELIFKLNTNYTIMITSTDNSNVVSYQVKWYEE